MIGPRSALLLVLLSACGAAEPLAPDPDPESPPIGFDLPDVLILPPCEGPFEVVPSYCE